MGTCSSCGGSGTVGGKTCARCGGKGTVGKIILVNKNGYKNVN